MSGLLTLSAATPSLVKEMQTANAFQDGKKNIIIIIFDAFSAYHLSLLGYERKTTPNIARLAERAVVYHNHYAGGSYSTPGTASLFTSVYPWKHRAFKFYSGVSEEYSRKSVFNAFDGYYRIAYSHNPLVNSLLDQFASSIEEYIPLEQFLLTSEGLLHSLFRGDNDTATVGWSREIKKEEGYSYSLFLADVYKKYMQSKIQKYALLFPRGLPSVLGNNYFLLEDALDALGKRLIEIPKPFLGYFHLMPPHQPYNTQQEFYHFFKNDGLKRVYKPKDLLAERHGMEHQILMRRRQEYDEFILYVDREFGKFMDRMESSGLLENTWIALTSDHGELFERGVLGHMTEILYQPLIRVPLFIFEPGRKNRVDVHSKTVAVDILPTLMHVTGAQAPSWTDGIVMPPYAADTAGNERNLYVMQSKETEGNAAIKEGTFILIKGQYKLMYFFGYETLEGQERVELYDVEQDPEELNNLYLTHQDIGKPMLDELKTKLEQMNKPYLAKYENARKVDVV